MSMLIFAAGAGFLLGAGLAGLWAFWYRRGLERQMNEILRRLDEGIAGRSGEEKYDEALSSAIGEKLNRLLEISRLRYHRADSERNCVKSLISDISHQVRTPLSNILLYAGLLREEETEPSKEKMAGQIQAQAEKLDFFMKELARSSYLETEMLAVSPRRGQVDELIRLVCQDREVQAMKKNILFQIQEQGFWAVFDMKWTREALGNILDNGLKYSPFGSSVFIDSEEYESFVCVRIRDQGMGIREKEQGLIFQRFYRSKEAAGEQGLGIGLYLAQEIAKKQGGYIKVDSQVGEGSQFSLFLPKREEMCQNCHV